MQPRSSRPSPSVHQAMEEMPQLTLVPEARSPRRRAAAGDPVDVAETVRAAVEATDTGPRPVTPIIETDVAVVDGATLHAVVANLLIVEASLTPPSTRLYVSAIGTSASLVVTVEDDAPTVPAVADLLRDDAETTAQIDAAAARARRALGVVQGLVRRAGGRAWIEPGADGGTCYVVDLPTAAR